MAELAQLESSFRKADAAGDTVGAKVLADAIRSQRTSSLEIEKPEVTGVEKFVGFPVTRAALGPPTAAMGLAQMGGKALGIDTSALDHKLAEIESAKRKGMDYWAEHTGIFAPGNAPDWMGIAGGAALGGHAVSGIPAAASTLGKIAQGAGIGAGFGVATPTEPGPHYWGEKALQAGTGAGIGGAIPALFAAKSFVAPNEHDINRLVLDYLEKIIGKERIPEVIHGLRAAAPTVPGGVVTAARALKDVPGGSPVIAHEGVIASTPGGPSARFIEAAQKNKSALTAFEKSAGAELNALKTQALAAVNAKGGVPTDRLFHHIASLPSVKHATAEESDFILKHLTDQVGNAKAISAETLYAMRDKFAERFSGTLSKELRSAIDDAMEQSGGTGWKAFLKKYPEMLDTSKAAKTGERTLYRTPTKLGGEASKHEQLAKLPHLIEHEWTEKALRAVRGDITPRLQSQFADLYLQPNELASALDSLGIPQAGSLPQAAATIAIPKAVIEPRKERHP